MTTPIEILVDPAGRIRFLYDDALAPLMAEGQAEIKRASHVGPVGTEWWADLGPVGGPMLGPFKLRREALDAEKAWLLKRDIPFPGGSECPT